MACLLLAIELYGRQRYAQADLHFKRGVSRRCWLILHPFALEYMFKRLTGSYPAAVWDKWKGSLIQAYRRMRYDYRYYQNKKETGAF